MLAIFQSMFATLFGIFADTNDGDFFSFLVWLAVIIVIVAGIIWIVRHVR